MTDAPITTVTEWLKLTPRQIELLIWQFLDDMGGEVSTPFADDLPGRTVMFYRDDNGRIGMISNEECT